MSNKFLIPVYVVTIVLAFIAGIILSQYDLFSSSRKSNSNEVTPNREIIQSDAYFDYRANKLETLISVNPENSASIREQMTNIIFGNTLLPQALPGSVYEVQDTLYGDIFNLSRIEQFEIIQGYDIRSVGYIFKPKEDNHRLFIYHQGHDGDFIIGKPTIKYFVNQGFTVYAFCMPLLGKNNQPVVEIDKIGRFKLTHDDMMGHESMKSLDHPISFFVTPVVTMINYAQAKRFRDITMCGISGGGWTTNIVSAIDTRINYSFPVAGSSPMYIKLSSPLNSYGDFEQNYLPLYTKIGYLDMYVLGATGKNRFQVQVLNLHDPCCFEGTFFQHYEPFVTALVKEFDHGSFQVMSDTLNLNHEISDFAMNQINEKLINAKNILKRGLNPNNPSDGTKDLDEDGYTNVEEFLNGTPVHSR